MAGRASHETLRAAAHDAARRTWAHRRTGQSGDWHTHRPSNCAAPRSRALPSAAADSTESAVQLPPRRCPALSRQLLRYAEQLSVLEQQARPARQATHQRTLALLRQSYPGATVGEFGSIVGSLRLPGGDLDLMLEVPGVPGHKGEDLIQRFANDLKARSPESRVLTRFSESVFIDFTNHQRLIIGASSTHHRRIIGQSSVNNRPPC